MLAIALHEPDPVVIFEHALLYPQERELEEAAPSTAWPTTLVRRSGRDLTLVTYGGSLHKALQAAEKLSTDGIEVEVLDLRSLRPMDLPTILQSVAKTRRAMVVDEGWRTCSLAAEIIARIAEEAFYELDAPPSRVCSAIHESLRVEIPENDYAKLATLDGGVEYLAARIST